MFNFSFAAKTPYDARAKLHQVYAPAVVKALVETALDAIPAAAPESGACVQAADGNEARVGRGLAAKPLPVLIGVFVEVWGHLADAGGSGASEIQRFVVKPLFA